MKKRVLFGFAVAVAVTVSFAQTHDYGSALDAAIKFYDANRCGPNAGTGNQFSWRGACHTDDKDGSIDLTGGYHDAGDHVKFGLPQCWSAATLAWAMYEFPDVFAPRKAAYFRMLKWFTDYFLKCHPSANVFYYGVGDGNADHGYWGTPEAQTGARPVRKAPPGSDVCALASSALSLMYLIYKSEDAAYAERCLTAAKSLYAIALANYRTKETGRSTDGAGGNFYKTSSHYDDMCWGGIWLYTATGTSTYLDSIYAWTLVPNDPGDNHYQKRWSPAWDDNILFVLLKMAEITGDERYYQGLVWNLEWCRDVCNKSPYGIPVIDVWGVLRYASAEAGLGFLAYKLLGYNGFNTLGGKIIDYCLGTNPETRSYLTGWGRNPPIHPHHRANEPVKGGAVKGVVGALVGGPTDDVYNDNIDNFQETEVALDYNASFILGLAGQIWLKGGGKPKNRAPSVKIASPLDGVEVPQGATITIKVVATDADGKVTKIELFKGEQSVASGTTSPLTYQWQNAPLGDATFKANAVDDSGNVSKFTTVTIHVAPPCIPGQMMSRTGWVASASHTGQNAEDAIGHALDGNASTRWGSGTAQTNGMWFQLDMGYPRDFDQIVLDATASGNDFPRKYTVYATNDTASLGSPIATGTGAAVTTITPASVARGQYLRIVNGEANGQWWSIHEINVRCAASSKTAFTPVKQDKALFWIDATALNNTVRVDFSVPEPARVTVEAYSLSGTRSVVLVDGFRNAGHHVVSCDAERFSSKMVILKISCKGSSKLKRVILAN
ncbi:MAG: glycoside hydrolase family 9 protein [Chitinispirillaceae bacterium]|nr:glycoside hydrolase family 9 protein [Chitinispirillaceae bacterium]